jgi:6-phospho-beta-galactosidase
LEWIQEQRRKWYAKLPATHTMGIRVKEDVFRRLAHRFHPYISALPKTIEAVYESPYDKTLDAVGIDYYDPVIGNSIKLPGHATAGERNFTLRPMLWDSVPDPAGLTTFCEINTVKDLDVWVVENGLCNRVKKGRAYQRLDGWDRPRYLRENLAGVVAGIESGIPITGYWHWSLVDNYEWGSYEPRFGIFGIDRERGVRWKETDSMGNDSRQAYRDIIQGLRKGDLSVVRHAL